MKVTIVVAYTKTKRGRKPVPKTLYTGDKFSKASEVMKEARQSGKYCYIGVLQNPTFRKQWRARGHDGKSAVYSVAPPVEDELTPEQIAEIAADAELEAEIQAEAEFELAAEKEDAELAAAELRKEDAADEDFNPTA